MSQPEHKKKCCNITSHHERIDKKSARAIPEDCPSEVRAFLAPLGFTDKATYETGDNLLHIAVCQKALTVIEWLLNKGFKEKIDAKNLTGRTPLRKTALGGLINIMKCLLAHGAKKYEKDIYGNNLLMLATLLERTTAVEWLLNNGFKNKINSKTGFFKGNPLFLAASRSLSGNKTTCLKARSW